ncbi:hypothetical protein [Neorhizobium sp. JUb45]|uniref:hypothetical protein n=1 Tax=Neorhizobium sp. JUb45 TaxID=2485113 RepID=UPI001FE099E8|nr:hypothetical protein [Neorhizobium sp. JUb45]
MPITTKQPERSRFAFEIPAIKKSRAGLDTDPQVWIIMGEFNGDVIGNSFHIEQSLDRSVQQGVFPADSA